MKKCISILLIIIGLIILSYPILGKLLSDYEQQKLIKEWQKSTSDDKETSVKTEDNQKARINFIDLDKTFKENQQQESKNKKQENKQPLKHVVLGILKIPKINLKYPVLDNVNSSSLSVGLGWIPGTSQIGHLGNAGIAGHRSHTYNKFFNRLDELNTGDLIYFEDNNSKYTFEVYEKLIVSPADISVLSQNNKYSVITLITCHPLYVSSHRLIIHAKLKVSGKQ